jgi:hypothetical protein
MKSVSVQVVHLLIFFSFKDREMNIKFVKTRTMNYIKGLMATNIQTNTNNINDIRINALT